MTWVDSLDDSAATVVEFACDLIDVAFGYGDDGHGEFQFNEHRWPEIKEQLEALCTAVGSYRWWQDQ